VAEVIIAKNRSGATGTAKLTFLRNIMRFESLSSTDERFGRSGGEAPFHVNGSDEGSAF
jgi:hypothetical protein